MRPNIKAMFHELNETHFGGEIPDIPVVWNTRMTTTAGYCRYKKDFYSGEMRPWKIDLSDKLFRNEGYDHSKVERTLIHEMVHAFLVHKYNEGGHTARFQRMMTDITGERKNHRCHNYNTEGLRRKKKYFLVCERCGSEHGMARRPKYPTYKHRGCGGKMTLKGSEPKSIKIF